MKTFIKAGCGALLLCVAAFASSAQVVTWVSPPGQVTAQTNILAANQILEVLSAARDTHSAIEVAVGEDRILFGPGGAKHYPTPFIVAGPAEVVFRQVSASASGTMFTFSISTIEPAVRNAARVQ